MKNLTVSEVRAIRTVIADNDGKTGALQAVDRIVGRKLRDFEGLCETQFQPGNDGGGFSKEEAWKIVRNIRDGVENPFYTGINREPSRDDEVKELRSKLNDTKQLLESAHAVLRAALKGPVSEQDDVFDDMVEAEKQLKLAVKGR